jgi:hypothetical protein
MPTARGAVEMQVAGAQQYRELSARLRGAARGDLQRRLNGAIRNEGQPALNAVQHALRTVRITPSARLKGRQTGLRQRVADATRISVLQSGISIRVEPGRVDPRYGKSLSYGVDGLGRWRHPVFGNRNVWVAQQGEEVFFSNLTQHEASWRAGIERAMRDMTRTIEGG